MLQPAPRAGEPLISLVRSLEQPPSGLLPPDEALGEVAALWRTAGRAGEVVEIYLHTTEALAVDLDPASGLLQESLGGGAHATVRLWTPAGYGKAEGWWQRVPELGALITAARAGAAPGLAPPPEGLEPPERAAPPAGALNPERARALASKWAGELRPLETCIQALLVQESLGWCGVYRSNGGSSYDWLARTQALVRCETERGALVDGVATPWLQEPLKLSAATERLATACEVLRGTHAAIDPALPLVLRPPVAAPLAAGLAWALQGEVAASVPGLVRAVGKKIFPSVLSVLDDPCHPDGTSLRRMDDEGRKALPVMAIEDGQLRGFFHSQASAAHLGVSPNGHAQRAQRGEPGQGTFNLHIEPGRGALPEDRTELVARIETFTTMRQPGVVSLMACGWEYRGGQRHRRVGPVELELPILATFRQLQAVGSDLTFFPTADGCGTPTLVLSPPSWLGDAGSR